MRFRTRAFLLCFVPFAVLLTGSFWTIQKLVQSTVRDGLRTSLRENHLSIARLHARNNLQNSRFLKVVGENASLKAGIQLLASYPGSKAAKQTVEDQLQELCQQMGFDILMISDVHGTPLAGVIRAAGQLAPIADLSQTPRQGSVTEGGKVYQMASTPIDQGEENLGELSIGERFDFSEFNTPAVLIRNGQVLQSSLPVIPMSDVQTALARCPGMGECDIRLAGNNYISLPLQSISLGDGYLLRSLQNVDSAAGPVQAVLNRVFLIASIGIVLAALMCSVFSSRSIVKPIATMIAHLRRTEGTGVLPEFQTGLSSIREIEDLTASFNRAAGTIREARQTLQHAYVEFIGSLAHALDARDPYTAGHSNRVSDLACATAAALGVPPHDLEEIRIGALLHDIGKIGISDTVLQKAGQLTEQEFALIKQHPVIGRRILEGVQGFAPYLAAVELHHENWDGSGYPLGQSGENTPIAARVIHVSDAYDAMTTDRPYRKGMSHRDAIRVLREFAGRHFDPRVVEVFTSLPFIIESGEPGSGDRTEIFALAGSGDAGHV
ncbi:MAG TPA: HD-GYP domain-containing protein [Bryobacteraceae bacterium]|jgi:HD-GYP domain-containing protein (c-di-GMP phosphodiesterase class II)|nr:HD-GYP domain-containing protein [Bryobacteraceae bacterium]